MERLQASGSDNWHAKRIVCELIEAWTVANKDKDEENLDEEEVKSYASFVVAVLSHYDRWIGKFLSSDDFCKTLTAVHRKLEDLKTTASSSERQYAKVLERLYEKSSDFCDHALRLVLLSCAENHAEMEAFINKRGPITLKHFSNRTWRTNSTFWASDYGQMVDTALVRGDPARFRAAGCWGLVPQTSDAPEVAAGAVGSSATWSMWTFEGGQFKVYEYNNVNEANQQFSQVSSCAVLVGPTGKVKDKAWTSNAVIAKVLQNEITMQQLHTRVDNHLNLHRAAVGLTPLPETKYVATPSEAPRASVAAFGPRPSLAPGADNAAVAAAAAAALQGQNQGAWFQRGFSSIAVGMKETLDNIQQKVKGPAAPGQQTSAPPSPSRGGREGALESRRPSVGDRVRILQENEEGALESPDRVGTKGKIGVIVEDDGSNQPFYVDLGDGKSRWYTEEWVALIEEPAEGAKEAEPPARLSEAVVEGKLQPLEGKLQPPVYTQPGGSGLQSPADTRSETTDLADSHDCGGSDAGTERTLEDDVSWYKQTAVIYNRWTGNKLEATGLTENFRGSRKVKWQEGMVSKASDMPSLILDLPRKFSNLLECHVQVMGAVNAMVSRGGSKEGLAAIYALRQRSSITGQLASCMDAFIAATQLAHGVLQHELFKSIEQNKRLSGQLPAIQRMYLTSFNATFKLRDAILTEWHQLALKVNDAKLADEFRRCDAVARESYNQLMRVPVVMNALTDGGASSRQPLALTLPAPPSSTLPVATVVATADKARVLQRSMSALR